MKAAFLTAAAVLMGSAMAHEHHHHHNHEHLHNRAADEDCGCYTSVITYWGSPTLIPIAPPSSSSAPTTTLTSTAVLESTAYSTVVVTASPSSSAAPLPTNSVTVFPTPGTYTIPASTVTVSTPTVIVQPTSTALSAGVHTIGGVTTIVETSTTVVCPFATVSPSGSTVTSVIETTTYVCPEAGTYTIAPTTTSVSQSTVVVYPTPLSLTPGTYSKPEQTVTVTETSFTYVCPFASQSSSSSIVAATPVSAPAPATTSVPASSPPASHASSSTSSPSAAPSAVSGTGSGLGQHDNYAVTYTGYTHDTGACMSASDVKAELETIVADGFYAIRMYSTDCSQMDTVATQAVALGLRVILGVYIGSGGVSSGSSQITDIIKWGEENDWNGVEFIVLDNEAVNDGYVTAAELAGFVTSAKATIKAAGYTGDFTISEPLNIWQASGSTLCPVVDFASANLQAFFNADVLAAAAGTFVASEVALLKTICNNEQIFVGECGWPNQGSSNGKAIPGSSEQEAAIASIRSAVGKFAALFSYKDDKWKSPGQFGVEQFWGIY